MRLDKTNTLLIEHLAMREQSPMRDEIIKKAHAMHYDDFNSPLATPKMQLYKDLTDAGYPDLALNVKKGTYD